ncbi:unnamed protein product [Lymnaea stagnalis]|uniref:C2H2-type domain-containing protein n=1 Tax=Lymnaea stagnalis TaxID=6523 RepID=A0AAV2H0U6_LYMST
MSINRECFPRTILNNNTSESAVMEVEENKNKMQIVLTNEGDYSELGSNGMIIEDSVSMEDINLVLDKDTRVLYLNPDGTLVFDHTVLSSGAGDNNPLVLEPNTSYMLSTALQGNVVLSSNDLPSASGAPKQLSFTASDINEEGTKLCHLNTDYSQQTVTMVIDRGQSLGSEYILVEPNSFMPSGSQALTLDVAKGSQGLYSSLDISKLNQCSTPSSTTIHHKPNEKMPAYPLQVQQVAGSTPGCITLHFSSQQILPPGTEASSLSLDSSQSSKEVRSDEFLEPDGHSGGDGCILEKQKTELRNLEQSHLEHHIKQIQKRNFGSMTSIEGDSADDDNHEIEVVQELEKAGIDDDTPIFSSISARLNSTILKLVPGCQQFLLEQAKQESTVPSEITFDSNLDCTFSGDLSALLKLHNSLKRMIKLRSRTLLDFKFEKYGKSKDDKSLNCELLKPYVSSRGRQPKCSLKASQMGFVTSLDNYLNLDGILASNESRKVGGRGRKNICGNRRKRGRPRKVINSLVNNAKMSFETLHNIHEPDSVSSANDVHGGCVKELECVKPVEDPNVNISEQQTSEITFESPVGPPLEKSELDSSDPVCQRLLEEQTKYKKVLLNHLLQKCEQKSIENELPVHDVKTPSMDNDGCKDVAQENSSEPKISNTIIKRRGRPCKKYDPHLPVEKVQPRNPLTESPATKQQRNYEEHLAFKFFCTQCSFKTKRQSHFLSHMRCHKDGTERKHSCTHCEFVTLSVPMLKRHELKHKQNLFSCNLCGAYTTDRNELLRRHIKLKHNRERSSGDRLSCPNCPFTCFKPKEMTRHQVAHDRLSQISDADPNSCPHCKKSFRSRMHLHRHIRDVHGPEIRPHLCDTCGKAFKRTDALQQHKLVHVSRQARTLPFKCQTCDKGFRSPAHLKEHMSMHSSERPFLCQYCGAAFKTQPVQRKHIMTLHLQPRTHVCRTCCRQFNTKYALQRHESTHKTESGTAAAILIIESEDTLGEKVNTVEEKTAATSALEGHSEALTTCEAPNIIVDNQESSCLVQDIIGSAATVIEEPLDQSGQGLQRAYIQGSQDGTLYYFTGELSTL